MIEGIFGPNRSTSALANHGCGLADGLARQIDIEWHLVFSGTVFDW